MARRILLRPSSVSAFLMLTFLSTVGVLDLPYIKGTYHTGEKTCTLWPRRKVLSSIYSNYYPHYYTLRPDTQASSLRLSRPFYISSFSFLWSLYATATQGSLFYTCYAAATQATYSLRPYSLWRLANWHPHFTMPASQAKELHT